MNGFLALSQGDRGKTLQVGEFVTLEILVEGAQSFTANDLAIKDFNSRWYSSGSFTIDTKSFQIAAAEGNSTKITVRAMVHQPDTLFVQSMEIVTPSGSIFTQMAQLSGKAAAPEGIEKLQPQWFLPTHSIGGWNIPLLSVVGLLTAIALFFLFRWLYRKLIKPKIIDYRTRTIAALQNLQKYSRGKAPLKQEEWKKFSFELAGIMRKYCDDNFRFDSSDLTDREFLRELRFHATSEQAIDSLAKVLSTIDEVRYGKKELDLQVIPQLLLESRKFVDQTFKKDTGGKE